MIINFKLALIIIMKLPITNNIVLIATTKKKKIMRRIKFKNMFFQMKILKKSFSVKIICLLRKKKIKSKQLKKRALVEL